MMQKGTGIYKQPDNPDVQCVCQPGLFLDVRKKPKCSHCPPGQYSDGSFTKTCKNCTRGYAAIPGLYLNDFSGLTLLSIMKQNCSGKFCEVGYFDFILNADPLTRCVNIIIGHYNCNHFAVYYKMNICINLNIIPICLQCKTSEKL